MICWSHAWYNAWYNITKRELYYLTSKIIQYPWSRRRWFNGLVERDIFVESNTMLYSVAFANWITTDACVARIRKKEAQHNCNIHSFATTMKASFVRKVCWRDKRELAETMLSYLVVVVVAVRRHSARDGVRSTTSAALSCVGQWECRSPHHLDHLQMRL